MNRRDREVDMSQYELPDDEPLDAAEMGRLDVQRDHSRAALVNRAASMGMTPMEMFASGGVVGEMPDDQLVYDQSRQLPSAEVPLEMMGERTGEYMIGIDRVPDEEVLKAKQLVTARPRPTKNSPVQDWLDKHGAEFFKEGFDDYFNVFTEPPPEPSEDSDDEDIVDAEVVEERILWPHEEEKDAGS